MKKLFQNLNNRLRTAHRYRPEVLHELNEEYEARSATSSDLLRAKRLHASVYIENKYIQYEQVQDGIITAAHDPYQHRSQYFVVAAKRTTTSHKKGEIVAVARQIEPSTAAAASLPVFQHTQVSRKHEKYLPNEYVEISALVKRKGISSQVLLLLFRTMLLHSERMNHKVWFMALDERAYWRFKTLFPYALRRIGKRTFYMGSFVIPTKVTLTNVRRDLLLAHLLSPPPFRSLRKGLRQVMA